MLGNGSTTNLLTPIQISTDNDWVSITSQGIVTLGLKNNGTLWSWGSNLYGQFGDGTLNSHYISQQAGTDTTWVSITAGETHVLGLKSNGALWAWGGNDYGQLGDNNNPTYQKAQKKLVLTIIGQA